MGGGSPGDSTVMMKYVTNSGARYPGEMSNYFHPEWRACSMLSAQFEFKEHA
jgi:hypothetical protein